MIFAWMERSFLVLALVTLTFAEPEEGSCPVEDAGWGLRGTDRGCCSDYEGCCVYASAFCFIMDSVCPCCNLPDHVCGTSCIPEPGCGGKPAQSDAVAREEAAAVVDGSQGGGYTGILYNILVGGGNTASGQSEQGAGKDDVDTEADVGTSSDAGVDTNVAMAVDESLDAIPDVLLGNVIDAIEFVNDEWGSGEVTDESGEGEVPEGSGDDENTECSSGEGFDGENGEELDGSGDDSGDISGESGEDNFDTSADSIEDSDVSLFNIVLQDEIGIELEEGEEMDDFINAGPSGEYDEISGGSGEREGYVSGEESGGIVSGNTVEIIGGLSGDESGEIIDGISGEAVSGETPSGEGESEVIDSGDDSGEEESDATNLSEDTNEDETDTGLIDSGDDSDEDENDTTVLSGDSNEDETDAGLIDSGDDSGEDARKKRDTRGNSNEDESNTADSVGDFKEVENETLGFRKDNSVTDKPMPSYHRIWESKTDAA